MILGVFGGALIALLVEIPNILLKDVKERLKYHLALTLS